MRKVVKIFAIAIAVVIVIVLAYAAYVFIDYYTDEQSEGKKIPVIQKVTLLPFLPSFSYTYKF